MTGPNFREAACSWLISKCGAARGSPLSMSKIAMPEKSSTEFLLDQPLPPLENAGLDLTRRTRLVLLAANYIPLVHILAVATAFCLPGSWGLRVAAGLGALYLAPPLLLRASRALLPVHEGRIEVGDSQFLRWWLLFQLQGLFNRFPALEELLRLVPGLYSLWLPIWGAKIGRLTYWASGTLILDRPFLDIGDNIVFGAGVRL